ncbi:TetR/AcrR family transcriptional regulator [Anaerocolumna sp. MB42-C2]|uniref:TetR/AcrR family transcriptional regulator n=1 Tax=Anaerocolumna sp. MB42-C2 TaxID=3070997 RepID=UPI0027E10D73|nr:TetR/AcrR family transcriptional regulator [Anaerocolumna sp. MB42-C2]WMJ88190.1 TetR/AcrR family transcriptional regulator [Anaerocolumna sp. MB42-C2]
MESIKQEISKKKKIIDTAWKLFYEQGYDTTTIEQIISECKVSKGTFYHYFSAKTDLFSSLSDLFDEQYRIIIKDLDPVLHSFDKLIYMSRHLFKFIEDKVPVDILAYLYSSQVTKKGEKHLLNQNRYYYKALMQIIEEGQLKNELKSDRSSRELMKIYAMQERSILYDWCICEGNYPLASYGIELLSIFMQGFIAKPLIPG